MSGAAALAHDARALALGQALAAVAPAIQLRFNRNRGTLISLRGERHAPRLSLHVALLEHPAALAELPEWLRRNGRGHWPGIKAGIEAVLAARTDMRASDAPPIADDIRALPRLGGPLDLSALFTRVHRTWFAHLPPPPVTWARNGPLRQRHIRFGCYRRRPTPLVSLHPKLDQPWIAWCFVEHVLFHELCHHAQACAPVRGENPHSARFKAWERRYPLHAMARRWERAYLQHVLGGSTPPE
ncbi:MAG TPA: hypothetical protein VEL07_16390 [Planctomycetota bacterium]|nr:hypothetical protein [Planctomycetota bacterium]